MENVTGMVVSWGASWVFPLAVGLAVSLLVVAAVFGLGDIRDPLRRRVRALAASPSGDAERKRWSLKAVAPLAKRLMPKKDAELSAIRQRLMHAGYGAQSAPATFFAIKVALALAFPVLVLLVGVLLPRFTPTQLMWSAVLASIAGLLLPDLVLSRKIETRQRLIVNAFPDALDLIVACTEAGLGLNAAFQRVADELALSHAELASELGLVNSEMRAGVDRVTALRNLATRTGVDDIRGLVSLLAQSMRFGTSIADSLRIYAEELRDKRMQRAEEAAAKVGTKMIFPLVLCIFPSFFIVMVGPAVLAVLRVLQSNH
jgi:tight adherence protein C